MIYEQIICLFYVFCCDLYLMVVMCGIIGVLVVFYYDLLDVNNFCYCEIVVFCLLLKMLIMVVMCYKYFIGQLFVYLCNDFFYVGNFLNMMFFMLCELYEVNLILECVMDCILILYVDYEQNVFIFIVCIVGFLGVNLFVCIVVGIVLLWGFVYGGVNEVVLKMLEEISFVKYILEFVCCVKDKNDFFCLMGFGYCVYKNYDLCVIVMCEICYEVLKELGIKDDLLEVVMELENIVLNDLYFIEKKLYLNVDFYFGIILKVMGILFFMFIVIFVMVCIVGWIVYWSEMYSDGMKIVCLCQLYIGYEKCDFKSDIKC